MYLNIDALIAKEAYEKPSKRKTILERHFVLDPYINSKYVCVYVNRRNGLALLGIRGTDPSKPRDLFTDLYIGSGGSFDNMKRFNDVKKEYDIFLNKYPHNNRVVGHSLGGMIGEELGRRHKDNIETEYVLFNKGHTPYMNNESVNRLIKSYRIEKDLVSGLSRRGKTLKSKNLEDKLLERHSIEQFVGRGHN